MAARHDRELFFKRLGREVKGEVESDLFSRGRYASDASIYQCFPAGVVFPKTEADVAIALEMAREEGLSLVARGAGTSLAGQALGEGLVIDFSRHLNRVLDIDSERAACRVEPGVKLAALREALRPSGLAFPIDLAIATPTLGGMFANNASGVRSLRYGRTADRVAEVRAFLADGQRVRLGEIVEGEGPARGEGRDRELDLLQFGELHEDAIRKAWPTMGAGEIAPDGYDLFSLLPSKLAQNLSRVLAGSEGTLGLVTELTLKLAPRPKSRALGVCRFSSLRSAIATVAKILPLKPSAVELLDTMLIGILGHRENLDGQTARFLHGEPAALLLVEFDEENPVENTRALKALAGLLPQRPGDPQPALIEVLGRNAQNAVWRLRRDALLRGFALKTAAQPVAFLEDGRVPLDRLADYGADLEALLRGAGARALIHGHVGQGTLEVYPILNLGMGSELSRLKELQEAMAALVGKYGGGLTSGHGIGLARSALAEAYWGRHVYDLHRQLKGLLDPRGLLNPGKILLSPRFDDPQLLKAMAAAQHGPPVTIGAGPLASRAIEQAKKCAGLSVCLSGEAKHACPSYRVTGEEAHSPRGRANVLRLALSGALGEGALIAPEMEEALRLCVGCKTCRTACPFGLDVALFKAETRAAARLAGRGTRAEDLFARLPEYTEKARAIRHLLRLRDGLPALARFAERKLGLAADRPWPRFSGRPFELPALMAEASAGPKVAVIADTFNRAFEPQNLRASVHVLKAAGFDVGLLVDDAEPQKPLCCGRAYFDAGLMEEARAAAERFSAAIARAESRGIQVVGLEPNCLLMARDEFAYLGLPVAPAGSVMLLEEFVVAKGLGESLAANFKPIEAGLVLHSHCHERAAGVEAHAEAVLKLIPGLSVKKTPPSCCGLNGLHGMTPETLQTSFAMAELDLFPFLRKEGRDSLIAATGFSCRKQILDGLGQVARHPALILDLALRGDKEIMT